MAAATIVAGAKRRQQIKYILKFIYKTQRNLERNKVQKAMLLAPEYLWQNDKKREETITEIRSLLSQTDEEKEEAIRDIRSLLSKEA